MAVVDQYAMSVSFAHSLPLFLVRGLSTLLGRWRFPGDRRSAWSKRDRRCRVYWALYSATAQGWPALTEAGSS